MLQVYLVILLYIISSVNGAFLIYLYRRLTLLVYCYNKFTLKYRRLLKCLDCVDDDGIFKVKKYIFDTEMGLKKFNEQEKTYSKKIDAALQKYAELREQGAEFDSQELYEARQAIRSSKEQLAEQQLRKAYGEKYSAASMSKSRQEASRLLNEEVEKRAVMEKIQKRQQVNEPQPKKKRNKRVGR